MKPDFRDPKFVSHFKSLSICLDMYVDEKQKLEAEIKQKSGSNGAVPLVFQDGGAFITTPLEEELDSLVATEEKPATYEEAIQLFNPGYAEKT